MTELRQIVLDTETTGLSVQQGHRIIEIGCIELINRHITGEHFHYYINPERSVDPGAQAVHGITEQFLQDKPKFPEVSEALLNFIKEAELIIHNAEFDLSFLNYEMAQMTKQALGTIQDYCQIIDTLQLARKKHPGKKNSLDALCKRYRIDNSKRSQHGALLDAEILAQVYLAMTCEQDGGQGSLFAEQISARERLEFTQQIASIKVNPNSLLLLKADTKELKEHEAYMRFLQSSLDEA